MKKKKFKPALHFIAFVLFCLMGIGSLMAEPTEAKNVDGYVPLDSSNPIEFGGTYISYGGETITLCEKAIYIDGSLSDAIADKYDYVYNDFTEAAASFKDGTESDPMNVYIAPYVYWIDDPDDSAIRKGVNGDIPYGLIINCDNLHLTGLTDDPANVVLAVNRGQTHGAEGNYTMFYFDGNGTHTENLTMGNYCNVDLDYPLKPELSREKRTDTITQAQIALTNGDKILAVNCNFLSCLNACPFVGSGGRVVFKDCHIECGDDALPGTALYVDCSLGFYSSKPFYNTTGTGAVFLGCDITSYVNGTQYLTKAGGPVAMIDCDFKSTATNFKVEWTPEPNNTLKCIQANITLNGNPITIDADNPYNTIDLTDTEALKAFRIISGNNVIYNTYNLLQGTDGWDPFNNKSQIAAIDEKYICYPYLMVTTPNTTSAKTGTSGSLGYLFRYFRNIAGVDFSDTVTWHVDDAIKDNVVLTANDDGTCTYTVTNTGIKTISGMIYATSSLGFCSGTYISITPETLDAPSFSAEPTLTITTEDRALSTGETFTAGIIKADYTLNTEGKDISTIHWYRCDENGENRLLVSTTRLDDPEYTYELTSGDIGYYLLAEITPREEGSAYGTLTTIMTDRAITADDYIATEIVTDFQNFPTAVQAHIIPGFWTVAGYKPLDTADYDWKASPDVAWTYGNGEGGATGTGLLQTVRGSRILYTPMVGTYGDMNVKLVVDPCKSAGQGFGSATAQYMDVYIKMDNSTLNGYALRIERTNKYSNAVDFTLIKYEDGMTTPISESISASCYNSTCTIELSIVGTTFTSHVETTKAQSDDQAAAGLAHVVDLSAQVETNDFGGSGVLHTGTAGANATMLHEMVIHWDMSQAVIDYDAAYDYLYKYTEEVDNISLDNVEADNPTEETSEETESTDNSNSNKDNEKNSGFTIFIIIIVILLIAGAVILFIFRQRRNDIRSITDTTDNDTKNVKNIDENHVNDVSDDNHHNDDNDESDETTHNNAD